MTSGTVIPFNAPSVEGAELDYVAAAIKGGHSSAKGPYSAKVVELLRAELGAADVLLTTSCTAALELAALLLDLQPGDTVIVPSFTFVTTASAFVREGARVVFADIEEATLGIDPRHVAALLADPAVAGSVRAVVPVHYAGVGCDLDGVSAAVAYASAGASGDIAIIEDNAHGLFGRYRDAPLGSFGRMSTSSFHETKNFTCGEGGALVLNDAADVERAHILYDKGTNRRAFENGVVDKYTWVDKGSSFGLADILAAYLLGQLEVAPKVLAKREACWQRYRDRLEPEADRLGFTLPAVPADREQAFHMFYVQVADRSVRDRVLAALRADGITATFHYVPLHTSPMGRSVAAVPTECPVAERVSGRLLRLPFYNDLGPDQVDHIAERFLTALEAAT